MATVEEALGEIKDAIDELSCCCNCSVSGTKAIHAAAARLVEAVRLDDAAICQQAACFGDGSCQPDGQPPEKREHHESCPWACAAAIRERAKRRETT